MAHDLKLFGARAVDSMRMEKGFLHWKADLLTEFNPFETGLDRFVKLDKQEFIGKAALQRRQSSGPTKKRVSLKIEAIHAPAHGGASLIAEGRVVGTITSGDWGHRVGMNLAYAFVEPALAHVGTKLQLDMCGDMVEAEIIEPSPYDPAFQRLRA